MKLKIKIIAFAFFAVFCSLTMAQGNYHTQPLTDEIKSIQLIVNNDFFLPPVIRLNASDAIVLKFDKLSVEEPRLRYRIFHCTADWQKDNLSDAEFLNGFNDQLMEDFRYSQNTTVDYIHYDLTLPNRQVSFKISGNYLVEVYYENAPENPLLQACFSVTENLAQIRGNVSGNTDLDFNKSHQQLSFEILHPSLSLRDAKSEIITTIAQNGRLDNVRKNVQSTFIYPGRLVFEHNPDLIFEAGNEYRRFETQSTRFGGMGVQWVRYKNPRYIAMLQPDEIRANKARQYDQDQNGRFFIQTADGSDPDVEADYFEVYFNLKSMDFNLPVSLLGNFTFNNPEKFTLKYNSSTQTYQFSTLLKQGAYNYMFALPSQHSFSTEKTEGNFYDTENEYLIMVYYRPQAGRYDRLVGYQLLKSTQNK